MHTRDWLASENINSTDAIESINAIKKLCKYYGYIILALSDVKIKKINMPTLLQNSGGFLKYECL